MKNIIKKWLGITHLEAKVKYMFENPPMYKLGQFHERPSELYDGKRRPTGSAKCVGIEVYSPGMGVFYAYDFIFIDEDGVYYHYLQSPNNY